MKKGNVGLVLETFMKRLYDSFNPKVDLGLVGKDGVAHPSLEVSNACRCCNIWKTSFYFPKHYFLTFSFNSVLDFLTNASVR